MVTVSVAAIFWVSGLIFHSARWLLELALALVLLFSFSFWGLASSTWNGKNACSLTKDCWGPTESKTALTSGSGGKNLFSLCLAQLVFPSSQTLALGKGSQS